VLPFFNRMTEPDAYRWFVMLHVPPFAGASRLP